MYIYLLSSLPYLDFEQKPPLSYEDFIRQCAPLIEENARIQLEQARIHFESVNIESIHNPALRAWLAFENTLRSELVKVREKALNRHAEPFVRPEGGFHAEPLALLPSALEEASPYRREMNLLQMRWNFLTRLESAYVFNLSALVLYGLKLQLLERRASFEKEKGRQTLQSLLEKNLYGTPLSGKNQRHQR